MTRRVLLMGYFGAGNLGDDLLLAAWLLRHHSFCSAQNCHIAITVAGDYNPFSALPENTEITTDSIYLVTKQQLIMGPLDDYTALVAPGGSLLQDATSVRSLLFYLWVIHRFTRIGKPVFLLNQGLGPVSSFLGHYALRHVINRVGFVSLRDEDSLRLLEKYLTSLAQTNVILSSDPLIKPLITTSGETTSPQYILLIPKRTHDLPFPGEPISEVEALARFIDNATRESGLPAKLLAFHNSQDTSYCQELAVASGAEMFQWAPGENSIADFYRIFNLAGAVVSYRLHGLICSCAQHLPAFGVAYDRKIVSFANAFSLPYCFPAHIHTTQASDDFARLWDAHDEIKAILKSKAHNAACDYDRARQEFESSFTDLLSC